MKYSPSPAKLQRASAQADRLLNTLRTSEIPEFRTEEEDNQWWDAHPDAFNELLTKLIP